MLSLQYIHGTGSMAVGCVVGRSVVDSVIGTLAALLSVG